MCVCVCVYILYIYIYIYIHRCTLTGIISHKMSSCGKQTKKKIRRHCVISGFRRGERQVVALPGCYAAYFGILLPDVSGQHLGPNCNGQGVPEPLFPCNETGRSFRSGCYKHQPTLHKIPVQLSPRADNVLVFGSKSLSLFDGEMNTIRRGVWSPAHGHALPLYSNVYTPQNAHVFEVHRHTAPAASRETQNTLWGVNFMLQMKPNAPPTPHCTLFYRTAVVLVAVFNLTTGQRFAAGG